MEEDGGGKGKDHKQSIDSEPDLMDNRSHLTVDAIDPDEAENQIHLGLAARRSITTKGKSKKKKGKKKKKV